MATTIESPTNVITFPTREAWLERRRSGIGSSDVPIILGLSSYKSQT